MEGFVAFGEFPTVAAAAAASTTSINSSSNNINREYSISTTAAVVRGSNASQPHQPSTTISTAAHAVTTSPSPSIFNYLLSSITTTSTATAAALPPPVQQEQQQQQQQERKFWMKDDQCHECFECKLPFNPIFRRKHHCRICGQIFCHACIVLTNVNDSNSTTTKACVYCARLVLKQSTSTSSTSNSASASSTPASPLSPNIFSGSTITTAPPSFPALDSASNLVKRLFSATGAVNNSFSSRRPSSSSSSSSPTVSNHPPLPPPFNLGASLSSSNGNSSNSIFISDELRGHDVDLPVMTDQENLLNQTFANIEVKQCGDYNDDDDEDRDDKIDQTFFSDLAASQNHKPLFATALSSSITSPPLYSTVSPEVPGLATSPSSSSSRRNSKRFSTQSFNFLMGVAGSSELNNVVGEVGTVITASSTSDVDEAWVYNHQQSSNDSISRPHSPLQSYKPPLGVTVSSPANTSNSKNISFRIPDRVSSARYSSSNAATTAATAGSDHRQQHQQRNLMKLRKFSRDRVLSSASDGSSRSIGPSSNAPFSALVSHPASSSTSSSALSSSSIVDTSSLLKRTRTFSSASLNQKLSSTFSSSSSASAWSATSLIPSVIPSTSIINNNNFRSSVSMVMEMEGDGVEDFANVGVDRKSNSIFSPVLISNSSVPAPPTSLPASSSSLLAPSESLVAISPTSEGGSVASSGRTSISSAVEVPPPHSESSSSPESLTSIASTSKHELFPSNLVTSSSSTTTSISSSLLYPKPKFLQHLPRSSLSASALHHLRRLVHQLLLNAGISSSSRSPPPRATPSSSNSSHVVNDWIDVVVYLAVRAQSAVDLSSGNTSTAAVVDMVGVGASNTHPQLRSNASSTQPPLPSASPPIVDEMDIRSFVKIKRIPGGNPRDSFFIDGVVVSRQPIHRNFTRPIQHPRILMLACAIEYDARAGGSSSSISSSPSASAIQQRKYTSLEPLLSQETSHLKNTVARIMQLKPTLLLVGRTVARIALDAFIKAGVTVIVNVKMSALEDVSRCCGGAVVESIESLIMPPLQSSLSSSAYTFVSPQMGTCVLFECQTFVNDMIIHQEASVHVTSSFTGPLPPPPPNFRKTIMMFTQCPRRLGCTLVLRGGTFDDLAKVKPVLDMAVFAVRHLVLETSLFMDSFARLPKVPYTTYLSELDLVHGVHSYMDLFESRHRQLSEITGKPAIDFAKSSIASAFRQAVLPYHHCVLSLSPAVNFGVPYLLQRVLEYVDTSSVSASSGVGGGVTTAPIATSASPSSTLPLLRLAKPSISTTSEHGNQQLEPFPQSSTAALTDIHELSLYSLETRAGIRHLLENEDITSPLGHQSLIVLYSNMSKSTNIPCQAPEVHMLDYYRESDTTLGQFLEDLCLNAAYLCPSKVCGLPMLVHYRSYAHGTGRVNVSITKEDEDAAVISAVSEGGLFFDATAITKFLNGAGGKCGIGSFQLDDRILMWSSCRKCASTFGFHSISPVAIMSEETWRISFGKYLELTFYHDPLECRATSPISCSHDMLRDHTRFFRFQKKIIKFAYEAIDLVEVAVPPLVLKLASEPNSRYKTADLDELRDSINAYYDSLTHRIEVICNNYNGPLLLLPVPKALACREIMMDINRRAGMEKKYLLQMLQQTSLSSDHGDTLAHNSVKNMIPEKVAAWDDEFSNFIKTHLQFDPTRELRRLVTSSTHIRKIFDKDGAIMSFGRSALTSSSSYDHRRPTILPDDRPSSTSTASSSSPGSFLSAAASSIVSGMLVGVAAVGSGSAAFYSSGMGYPALGSSPKVLNPAVFVGDYEDNSSADTAHQGGGAPFPSTTSSSSPSTNEMSTSEGYIGFLNSSTMLDFVRQRDELQSRRTLFLDDVSKDDFTLSFSDKIDLVDTSASARAIMPTSLPVSELVVGLNSLAATENNLKRSVPRPATMIDIDESGTHDRIQATTPLPLLLDQETSYMDELGDASIASIKPSRASAPFADHENAPSPSPPLVPSSANTSSLFKDISSVHNPGSSETSTLPNSGDIFTALDKKFGKDDTSNAVAAHAAQQHNRNSSTTKSELNYISGVTVGQQYTDLDFEGDADNESDFAQQLAAWKSSAGVVSNDRVSLMKTIITNFWTGGNNITFPPLDYPISNVEHIFQDSLITVREDEPSSIIAFTLSSKEYANKINLMYREMSGSPVQPPLDHPSSTSTSGGLSGSVASTNFEAGIEMELKDMNISLADEKNQVNTNNSDPYLQQDRAENQRLLNENILLRGTGTHIKYQFSDGPTKLFSKIYFAEQFDALRKSCGCDSFFIESLSRCQQWETTGGKSGSTFLKTRDDRLVLKQLSRPEMDAFLKFAPIYFEYMSQALFHELPTVLAKIFGVFNVGFKNSATSKTLRIDLLVMENLFYQRRISRIFDLKGSMRNRHVQSTGKQNEVLLDENLVEFIYESPLFIREHSKRLLRASVWNDTLFLSKLNVMDYSLLVGIDEEKNELVIGIVDFIRTFTWDKKLESWVKETGFLGGSGKEPTIVSPRIYKNRFREAMERYFLMVPDKFSTHRL